MFSNRGPVKLTILSPKEDFNKVVDGLNPFLPMGYTLKSVTLPTSGNIFSTLSFLNVYESEKKDPWDNPYYFLIDPTARNAGETEYYFIVMSAGQNAQANVGGPLDKDDIFLLCEYNNGTVTTNVYNMSTDTMDLTGSPLTRGETSLISSTNGSSPRNTGKAAKDIAHTHNWKVETNTEPTCTSSGYKKTRCIICGEINEQTIPANGHAWSTSVTKQATCTDSGITSRTCTVCGQKIDSVIPPKGHSWDAGTVTKEPGIGTEGVKTRTCTVCHETNVRSRVDFGYQPAFGIHQVVHGQNVLLHLFLALAEPDDIRILFTEFLELLPFQSIHVREKSLVVIDFKEKVGHKVDVFCGGGFQRLPPAFAGGQGFAVCSAFWGKGKDERLQFRVGIGTNVQNACFACLVFRQMDVLFSGGFVHVEGDARSGCDGEHSDDQGCEDVFGDAQDLDEGPGDGISLIVRVFVVIIHGDLLFFNLGRHRE